MRNAIHLSRAILGLRSALQYARERFSWQDTACLLFIAYLVATHLTYLDPHFYSVDSSRDYLVARHIAFYGEFVGSGPSHGGETIVFSSPIYFYILATLLRIWDSATLLFSVNIILLAITITCIYVFGKHVFSPTTGLIAAMFFGLSNAALSGAHNISDPGMGQAFAMTSYILILLAYERKNFRLLLFGIVLYVFASAIYVAVLGVAPIIAVIAAKIVRTQRRSIAYYVGVAAVACVVGATLYFPGTISIAPAIGKDFQQPPAVQLHSMMDPVQFVRRATVNLFYLISSYFVFADDIGRDIYGANVFTISPQEAFRSSQGDGALGTVGFLGTVLFLAMLAIGGVYYSAAWVPRSRKRRSVLLLLCITVFVLAMALVEARYRAVWQFVPVLGILTVLLAEWVHGATEGATALRFAKMFIVIALVRVFMFTPHDFDIVGRQAPLRDFIPQSMALAIANEVKSLPERNGVDPTSEFRIVRYPEGNRYVTAPLWLQLEDILDARLVRNVDGYPYFVPVTGDTHVFFVCSVRERPLGECMDAATESHPNHRSSKTVFEDGSTTIVMAARET